MNKKPSESVQRQNRMICLPFQQETYGETVADALQFRLYIDEMFSLYPELLQNAWKKLFPSVTLILCFLHAFIGIRDRAKKKFGEIYNEIAEKLWN
ncbi:MAG: hypothetical protein GY749_12775 [Desulfobacteraceae bacterium]|nr:hypothetical protein [Desulfobacteraceae bacterium]